jgi:hypothetical protein
MTKLKIITINVNSLVGLPRRHNLDLFLRKHNPDIVLLCETKLNSKHKLSIRNYKLLRSDRQDRGGGGCGILIKESLAFERVYTDNIQKLEYCAITVRTEIEKLTLYSIYNNGKMRNINDDLSRIVTETRGELVIGGDFNARNPFWGGSAYNETGRLLEEWLMEDGLLAQMVLIPTATPTRNLSYLDFFIASSTLHIKYREQHPNMLRTLEYESDHKAVLMVIEKEPLIRSEPTYILDFSKLDARRLKQEINSMQNRIVLEEDRNLSNEEIDRAAREITEIIRSAMDISIPKIEVREKGLVQLNEITLKLIKYKKQQRRRLHRTGDDSIKSTINLLTKLIQEQIQLTTENYYQRKFSNIKMDNKTFKNIKNLTGLNAKENMPQIIKDGIKYTKTEEKVNLLAEHFEGIHKQNHNMQGGQIRRDVERVNENVKMTGPLFQFNPEWKSLRIRDNQEVREYNEFLNIEELNKLLKTANNKKSTGEDGIPYCVLKNLPLGIKKLLVILFNNMYNNKHIPKQMKHAKVRTLPKAGKDHRDVKNYRPISLLSKTSMIYEAFLHEKLKRHIYNNNVYSDHQFGFRKDHSTSEALAVFTTDVAKSLNSRKAVIATTLDTEKAFDTVWREGIVYKMKIKHNFSDHMCGTIQNYLEGRTFHVESQNCKSSTKEIADGVPQGSLLGPTLFNLFVTDLPQPDEENTKVITYADDIVAYTSHVRAKKAQVNLNNYLEKVATYMKEWRLKTNLEKCEAIKIRTQRSYPNWYRFTPEVKYGNQVIKNVKMITYLGVDFEEAFKFNSHVKKILMKAKKAAVAYSTVLSQRCKLKNTIKVILYKQIIRPILTYGHAAWANVSQNPLENIKIFERRQLRYATGKFRKHGFYYYPNEELYRFAKIEDIGTVMKIQDKKLIRRMEQSENPKVVEIMQQTVSLDDAEQGFVHLKQKLQEEEENERIQQM